MLAGPADLIPRRSVASPFQAMRTRAAAHPTPLCITWRIGARPPAGPAELRWTIEGDLATATLHANTPGAATPNPIAEGRLTRRIHDEEAGLEHFEVDGLLWLTLRHTHNAPPSLLFARTTLLTRLNIPGGRYTAPQILDQSEPRS